VLSWVLLAHFSSFSWDKVGWLTVVQEKITIDGINAAVKKYWPLALIGLLPTMMGLIHDPNLQIGIIIAILIIGVAPPIILFAKKWRSFWKERMVLQLSEKKKREIVVILDRIRETCDALGNLIRRRDGAFFLILEEYPYKIFTPPKSFERTFPGFNEARISFEKRLDSICERRNRLLKNIQEKSFIEEIELSIIFEELIDLHNNFVGWTLILVEEISDDIPKYQPVEDALRKYNSNYKDAIDKLRSARNRYNDSVDSGILDSPKSTWKIEENTLTISWVSI